MASKNGYPRRVSYRQSRPREVGPPTVQIIVLVSLVLFALAILMFASYALAAESEPLVKATFLENATTESGLPFDLTGSAYVEPQAGLRINESGRNLVCNPSFENGGLYWVELGGASTAPSSASAVAGSAALSLATTDFADGIMISTANGGIDPEATVSSSAIFSVYLRSESGETGDVWIALQGDASGFASAGPLTVTEEWQRYSVAKETTTVDTAVSAFIYPSTGRAAASILVDAAQLEHKAWLTPYFDGDQTGSTWDGDSHNSATTREAGQVTIDGEQVGLDLSRSWWFAIDVTLTFDRDDLFGSFPIGTKDFLNMGKPKGDGYGMVGDEGIVLDYYSESKNLKFYKLSERGNVYYPMPDFQSGDEMRVVCSWDPAVGMQMWVKVADNPLFHARNNSVKAKSASVIPPLWLLSVSGGYSWSSHGEYQSNSLHRNLVIMQGTVDDAMAAAYISDPAGFLADCGERPALSSRIGNAYWASMADYQSRLLSVDYKVRNLASGMAYDVTLVGSDSTNGTMLATAMPQSVGDISSADSPMIVTLKYYVPPGVTQFKIKDYSEARDNCGIVYCYPTADPRN